MIRVERIALQSNSRMKALYNSSHHTDMISSLQPQYDNMDTWYSERIAPMMRKAPWARIPIKEAHCSSLRELSLLCLLRHVSDTKLREYEFVQWLIHHIDAAVQMEGKAGQLIARLNECSMKRAPAGLVPFTQAIDIVRAILEDTRIHLWMNCNNISETALYLSDYDEKVQVDNEFRVFIFRGRVTGISQARWYAQVRDETDEEAEALGNKIVRFLEKQIVDALRNPMATLNADVIVDGDDVRLIEINAFGGHTGCGSALFHWKRDEGQLYGKCEGQDVSFRILERAPTRLRTALSLENGCCQ